MKSCIDIHVHFFISCYVVIIPETKGLLGIKRDGAKHGFGVTYVLSKEECCIFRLQSQKKLNSTIDLMDLCIIGSLT